ncbi:hypothetical protein FRC03_000739 [Tulasnella sp. 419]|nr:hypothetical protein FRC03_000739 [Tulasnella sp. 419]
MTQSRPTSEDLEELLLSCRYGELDEAKEFVAKFGTDSVIGARDESDNTVLHMACGNGHRELVEFLLSISPSSFISLPNKAKSTPLHWATLNKHLEVVKLLVLHPNGPGIKMIDLKNAAGRSSIGEAAMAEWQEGADWLISVMALDESTPVEENVGDVVESNPKVQAQT